MSQTLDLSPLGDRVQVAGTTASGTTGRRLAELGLRRGAVVRCIQRTAGGGRVVDIAGTRVALGAEVLRSVHTQPLLP